jgi:hypothetical protein
MIFHFILVHQCLRHLIFDSYELDQRQLASSFLNKRQRNKKFFLEKNFLFVFEIEILKIESDNEE